MNLLTFSIPFDIPNTIKQNVTAITIICHLTAPKLPTISPKYCPLFSAFIMLPLNDPTTNFKIQAITTVYPTAMATAPITGIIPRMPPPLSPRISIAFLKAPKGPVFMERPKVISPTIPLTPSNTTNMKYGTKNAAPPFSPTL